MRFLISLCEIALPLLYFATIWVYARAFFSKIRLAERLTTPLLLSTLLAHGFYLAIRTAELRHPPITSVFEIFSLMAFTVALVYSSIEWRLRIKSTGYFILMLPFFFQLVSSILIREDSEVSPILQSNLLGFHVSSALLGYAAITISAVYGLLYLMLYHEIKSSRFGVVYQRLPNLESLERMSFTATVFGFVFLTIAIIVGIIWMARVTQEVSYTDPKLFGTFVIWLLYAAGLTAKSLRHWQGRRMMVLSVFGFATAMFSMTVVNIFLSGFHKFY